MKKRILLAVLMAAMLVCMLAISASAAYDKTEVFKAADGTDLALYDAEGNALAWFYDSSASKYVSYRVGIDFTMSLNSGRELLPNTSISDTDNDANTTFPYTVANMVLLNGRDYAAFTYISGQWRNNNSVLEAIYVNNNFQWINKQSFNDNSKLRVFDIPKDHNASKLHIGAAFVKANALEYFFVPKNAYFESTSTFEYSTGIKSVEFHDEWTGALKGYEFNGCTALESVMLPSTITAIPTKFCYNTALKELTIPASVTSISTNAFANSKFASVVIPSGIQTIDQYAFAGNKVLTTVTFAGNAGENAVINQAAFENCEALTSIVIPEGITTLGNCAFKGCKALTSVTFPTTLTTLSGNQHFQNTGLTEVIGLENTKLTSIPNQVFHGLSKWKPDVIKIPNTVTSIGQYAFADVGMKVVILGKGLTTFSAAEAFVNCPNLQAVYVPAGITNFGTRTFNNNKTGNILFFVTSTDSSYLEQVKSNFTCADIVELETYNNDSATYAKGRHVISGYNACEAFYDGVHQLDPEKSNACAGVCSNCGEKSLAANPVHNYVTTIVYENYLAKGVKTQTCQNEGCAHATPVVTDVAPIITEFKGFSVSEKCDAITFGYSFDKNAIAEFEAVNGKIELGFVVAAKALLGENAPLNDDGTAATDKVVKASVLDEEAGYTGADFVLRGNWDRDVTIGEETLNIKDVEFYMAGYIIVNGAVSYLNYGASGATAGTVTFEQA
ncbi:MAG: leucine-rich repeat protein, partial [Clostridia bacterium]|nr:leucine-rich repeat protein [Clostridia bacterium]